MIAADNMNSINEEGDMEEVDELSLIHNLELTSLQNEFKWVLEHEVHNALHDLTLTLTECVKKFPMSLAGIEKARLDTTEKFILSPPSTTPGDQIKVVVTLNAEGCISHADINLKLPRPGTKDLYQNTSVREDSPWRLQQIQDAGNHLQLAITHLAGVDKRHEFKSAAEVDSFLSRIMDALQRGRNVLVNPTKRTLEELHKSKNVKALQPPLPPELALSFYLQGFKLIFAVYHIIQEKNVSRFNRYQAECVVPWVNDVLLLLTIGMQTIQQLKDKVNIFNQYEDLNQLE